MNTRSTNSKESTASPEMKNLTEMLNAYEVEGPVGFLHQLYRFNGYYHKHQFASVYTKNIQNFCATLSCEMEFLKLRLTERCAVQEDLLYPFLESVRSSVVAEMQKSTMSSMA